MCQPAARLIDRQRVDRGLVIDKRNLAVHVHNVRHPVAHTVGAQYTVCLRGFTVAEIAEQREGQIELIRKDLL